MSRRSIYVTIAVLATVSLLAGGCAQRSTPTASPLGTVSPLPTPMESAPATATAAQSAVQAPTQEPVNTVSGPIALGWSEAQELVLNGEVAKVAQTHDREVTLYLTDGRVVQTIEPDLDDVLELVERCGQPCMDLELMTE